MWKGAESIFLELADKLGLDPVELDKEHLDQLHAAWNRRPDSWPGPIDYSDQADPAWNLDLSTPYGSLISLAKALEADLTIPVMKYTSYLSAASFLRNYALMGMAKYMYDYSYDEVREFILKYLEDSK